MKYELTESMKDTIKYTIMKRLDYAIMTTDFQAEWLESRATDYIEEMIHILFVLGYTEVAQDYWNEYKEKKEGV